jgi:hypothetical protein
MVPEAQTDPMISIASTLTHQQMRRSLAGAHANDPVLPDRPRPVRRAASRVLGTIQAGGQSG